MPKKFKGENSKAVEARLRKSAAKEAAATKKKQEEDDEYWKDDDKHVLKKQQRKDEREKKKQENADKKQELKDMYDTEMSKIKSEVRTPSTKITRAQIGDNLAMIANEAGNSTKKDQESEIEGNVNRIVTEGDEARNIEDAISILKISEDKLDKHPERRLKAAYAAFESEHLPRLKEDNPNMRLSQLKQVLKKDWMKSPENPLNRRHVAYNTKQ